MLSPNMAVLVARPSVILCGGRNDRRQFALNVQTVLGGKQRNVDAENPA
ncbi:hypothetical protein V4C53_33870 [Paraburkholderia azotifigens]